MLLEAGPFAIARPFSHQSHLKAITLLFCGFGLNPPDSADSTSA
jgi:hypothetical protein